MSNLYQFAGPERYAHQKRVLRRLIAEKGVLALLCAPGTGKTAATLDYLSILAAANQARETRVLVVCPLAAVDTWVLQAKQYVGPQVAYWAEALGGSIRQRAQALASRGGRPYQNEFGSTKPIKATPGEGTRASHWRKTVAFAADDRSGLPIHHEHGPDALQGDLPLLMLEVVNLDTLSSRERVTRTKTMADIMLDAVKRFRPDVVVVDESHKIKAASGNASRFMARLAEHVERRILLTGTVMPHSPLDVYGQWRFLDPYAFGELKRDGTRQKATFGGFKNRYAVYGGWMGQEVVGFRNLDDMHEIMSKSSIVVRKEDALDLPPTTDVTVPVTLSPAEARAYDDLKKQLATRFAASSVTTTNRLTQLMRLRQVTSGHVTDDAGVVQVLGSSKVRTVTSLVNDTLAGENRIVVFSFFKQEIEDLKKALSQRGTEVLVVTGDVPSEQRIAIRERFGSDDPTRIVLVAQIKTMSLAVNELVTASHAIFASLSQQRDDYIQARDRLDRIGQTTPVTFWHVLVPGSVDEVILTSHRDRTDLEDAMLKHIHEGR